MSDAAHAQALRTRALGVGDDEPFGAAETHVSHTRVSGNGADIPQAFGGTVRAADSETSFNTANGIPGTVPSDGNNRFAGNGASALTLVGVQSHDSGPQ